MSEETRVNPVTVWSTRDLNIHIYRWFLHSFYNFGFLKEFSPFNNVQDKETMKNLLLVLPGTILKLCYLSIGVSPLERTKGTFPFKM